MKTTISLLAPPSLMSPPPEVSAELDDTSLPEAASADESGLPEAAPVDESGLPEGFWDTVPDKEFDLFEIKKTPTGNKAVSQDHMSHWAGRVKSGEYGSEDAGSIGNPLMQKEGVWGRLESMYQGVPGGEGSPFYNVSAMNKRIQKDKSLNPVHFGFGWLEGTAAQEGITPKEVTEKLGLNIDFSGEGDASTGGEAAAGDQTQEAGTLDSMVSGPGNAGAALSVLGFGSLLGRLFGIVGGPGQMGGPIATYNPDAHSVGMDATIGGTGGDDTGN